MRGRLCAILLISFLATVAWTSLAGAQPALEPRVETATAYALSPPLRDLATDPAILAPTRPGENREIPNHLAVRPGRSPVDTAMDPLLDITKGGPVTTLLPTPQPILSIPGTSDDDNAALVGGRIVPPDTNGDIGPNHYVQMNNLVYEVFAVTRDTNGAVIGINSVLGPLPNNSLWSALGNHCASRNDGDPIVFHDQLADRWVLSQFAVTIPGQQCIAVSTTPDPTGSYYLYSYLVSDNEAIGDYPKFGMWPDGYYMSTNEFNVFGLFDGAKAFVFDRAKMLVGDPTAGVAWFGPFSCLLAPDCYFSLQPSHWEGSTSPPAGAPNTFIMAFDDETWGPGTNPDGYELWDFAADFTTSTFSFTPLGRVTTTEFDAELCAFDPCVPQPAPGELLSTLGQMTMYRAAYRNFGTHESLLVNHTVDAGGDRSGIRWTELRKSGGGGWAIHQTGTHAPADSTHRFMGSIAMDGVGNIALSYSASSASSAPSVRYATRAAGDPLGTMSGGEVDCQVGTGVQFDSAGRWGDYSSISVDPVDDCTFWLTNEYYETTGDFDFNTRICAFRMADCGGTSCEPTEAFETSCDDGVDNDCNGLIDLNDPMCDPCPLDADGDTYQALVCGGLDCDDANAAINPGASEVCTDSLDNDCDMAIDCSDSDCSSVPPCCQPQGASCTVDSDCCGNKCRGPQGGKTCK